MFDLNTPLEKISRIGKITNKKFKKIGLYTIKDLIYYFPFRYDDYSKIYTISEIKTKKTGTIKGKIDLISNKRSSFRKMLVTQAIISDKTDSIKAIWFNQPFLIKTLKPGTDIYLAGKIENNPEYGLQISNPSYEICKNRAPIHTGRLVPIYRTTANLTQKQIRYLVRAVLPIAQNIQDWLPRDIKIKYHLINLPFALTQIHFPENKTWLEKAFHRLKFDELFLIQIKNHLIRKKIKSRQAPPIKFQLEKTKEFVDSLPFKLTNSQRKSAWEIISDIKNNHPMNRLLEGDVGSGKTIVATIGILNVLLNKYQVSYLTPTEILAEQQFNNISHLFKNFKFKIALFTRENILIGNKKIQKKDFLKKMVQGKINLIIGTHSLIQKNVKFKNLALAIVDEQHRFGVNQRSSLIKNSGLDVWPHFLSMTATPIPRSVALTLYGDLDLSIINEMPPGRKKIITEIVKKKEIEKTYQFIENQIKKGRQAFIICPLIDPSDKLGVKSVSQEYEKISKKIFPNLRIAKLHGKLKASEKENIMKKFINKKTDILISTTVVEVGIDIPNVSVMFIEGAERFGLAQLYQLRGRIGRSKYQSYCFLSLENPTEKAKKRLNALISAKNSFTLAEKDLKMRGPGEIFGTHQSGFFNVLRIAKLTDTQILKEAKDSSDELFSQNKNLKNYPLLKTKMGQFIKTVQTG